MTFWSSDNYETQQQTKRLWSVSHSRRSNRWVVDSRPRTNTSKSLRATKGGEEGSCQEAYSVSNLAVVRKNPTSILRVERQAVHMPQRGVGARKQLEQLGVQQNTSSCRK